MVDETKDDIWPPSDDHLAAEFSAEKGGDQTPPAADAFDAFLREVERPATVVLTSEDRAAAELAEAIGVTDLGGDLYTNACAYALGIKAAEVTGEQRASFKLDAFKWMYNATPFGEWPDNDPVPAALKKVLAASSPKWLRGWRQTGATRLTYLTRPDIAEMTRQLTSRRDEQWKAADRFLEKMRYTRRSQITVDYNRKTGLFDIYLDGVAICEASHYTEAFQSIDRILATIANTEGKK